MIEFIAEFFIWWYTDFIVGSNSWTSLINLVPKTGLLIVGLGIVVTVLKGIINFLGGLVVAFKNGWDRTMSGDSK